MDSSIWKYAKNCFILAVVPSYLSIGAILPRLTPWWLCMPLCPLQWCCLTTVKGLERCHHHPPLLLWPPNRHQGALGHVEDDVQKEKQKVNRELLGLLEFCGIELDIGEEVESIEECGWFEIVE